LNLLLDTHVALWAIADSPLLPDSARAFITNPANSVWVSAASIWEIAIKHSLGRGDMPLSGQEALDYFTTAGYRLLAVEPVHAAAVETLDRHHQDPFDRLLVAQALQERLNLLTTDRTLLGYGEVVQWAG